jgi:hypothetical protein
MSRRNLPLPLKSPDWVPITEAFEWRLQQTDSILLAVYDFDQALSAGELRALVRRADGQSELLARTVWHNDLHIAGYFSLQPTMAVFSRKLGESPPLEQWFFVWKTDYVRIFGAGPAPSAPVASSSAAVRTPSEERKGKGGRPLKHDWVSLALEASWLFRHNPKLTRNAVLRKLEDWCQTRSRPMPALSELQTLVQQVYEHVQKHDTTKKPGKQAF